jgi:pilus assembly protein CpaC
VRAVIGGVLISIASGLSSSGRTRHPLNLRKCWPSVVFALGLILCAAVCSPDFGVAQSGSSWVSDGESVVHVSVTVNKSRTFHIHRRFKHAVVGAPDILDAMPVSDRTLYLLGKKIGTTNVSVFADNGDLIGVIDVVVDADVGDLRRKIDARGGGAGIRVSSEGGQVVLSGTARDAVAADRAVALAKALSPNTAVVNAMTVAPSQQVMLKVRFLEATREAQRSLGVNWFVGSGQSGGTTGTGSVTPGTSGGIPVFQTVSTLANGGSPFGVLLANLVNSGTKVDVLVSALETKGMVRQLAEPDLVALSGDKASFLAGGEFPVPIIGATSSGFTTPSIQYKSFGVELDFEPTVLANGVINLRLVPSVSELDFTNAVTISGTTIPALTKREARTTIELRDGQSFAIAGLLQATNSGLISQLPWVGSVPVLGTLFRSTGYQQNETDLVVIVTPHLVRPATPGERLATPLDSRAPGNDIDAFLMGQLERRKPVGGSPAPGDVAGPYGHIIPTIDAAAPMPPPGR